MEFALGTTRIVAILCAVMPLAGCDQKVGQNVSERDIGNGLRERAEKEVIAYESALASGRKSIPTVQEFNRAFSSASNTISYHVGGGKPAWNAKVSLYDRYVVTLRIPITLSEDRKSVIDYGTPEFRVVEVTEVTKSGSIRYSEHQISFGLDEWEFLRKAGFDFSRIGYEMIKDSPVSGLSDAWKEA